MKRIISMVLLAGLIFPASKKESVDPAIREMSAIRGYRNWYIGNYRCGLFVPENYSKSRAYPLIIYLHGFSDTTSRDLNWYKDPIATKDPCIVLTPKCPREETEGWGSSFSPFSSPAMQKTYEMLAMAEKAFNLDRNRYYIYGTSMGGHGTYGVIQKHPDMFAAGFVLCGNGYLPIAPLVAAMPFWIFHGSDDPVVPVLAARNMYKAVTQLGGKQIRYTEYPGVGHNVWDYTRNESTLPAWLLAQRKGSLHASAQRIENFTATVAPENKIILKWKVPEEKPFQSSDNIWFCRIYRDGLLVSEVYNNMDTFIDSKTKTGQMYKYQLSAVNYYFKESRRSETVLVSIQK